MDNLLPANDRWVTMTTKIGEWLTPVLTRESMIRSFKANVSPCFILMRFLSKHFIAYLDGQQRWKGCSEEGMVTFCPCRLCDIRRLRRIRLVRWFDERWSHSWSAECSIRSSSIDRSVCISPIRWTCRRCVREGDHKFLSCTVRRDPTGACSSDCSDCIWRDASSHFPRRVRNTSRTRTTRWERSSADERYMRIGK